MYCNSKLLKVRIPTFSETLENRKIFIVNFNEIRNQYFFGFSGIEFYVEKPAKRFIGDKFSMYLNQFLI